MRSFPRHDPRLTFRSRFLRRRRRASRPASALVVVSAAVLVSAMSGPAAAAEQRAPAAPPQVIPMPASLTAVPGGSFELTRDTRISVTSRAALGVATALAERLRRATGFPLPVRVGGGIGITLGLSDASRAGGEDYTLTVSRHEVRLRAGTAEGLFRATQTLRQLLPAKAESPTARPGPWVVPGVRIADRPRFGWRGTMLDVSRHFFSVAEVKRYIDLAALYKINTLHLHLADDQGWRIVIDSWPRLATVGGSTEVGGGPGGFYTKADYGEIVRYAGERFITVVPEIDMPAHTHSAIASYPELGCSRP